MLEGARKPDREKGITDLGDIAVHSGEVPSSLDLNCSMAGNPSEPISEEEPLQTGQYLPSSQELQPWVVQGRELTSVSSGVQPYLSSPEEFKPMEQLLAAAQVYFSPTSTEFMRTFVRSDLRYSQELQEFERYVHEGAICADLADWKKAISNYGKAFDKVPDILMGNQSLCFLVCVFVVLGCCENPSRSAFIPTMLEFVLKCAEMVLSPYHPFCQLLHAISTNLLQIGYMIELGLQAALGILQLESLSFDPRLRILEYGLYETLFSRGKFFQAQQLIRETWRKEEHLLGKRHTLTIWSMMAVGRCAIELGNSWEADRIVNNVIQRVQMVTDNGNCSQLRTNVQVHIHSCTQLQRRRCQHRQSFNESVIAPDKSFYIDEEV
jgi:hypothetical protein